MLFWRSFRMAGVVAGCSAGAMIFGERIPNRSFLGWDSTGSGIAAWLFHQSRILTKSHSCFDLPHPIWLADLRLLGIEANTVLACSRDEYTVVGSGGVTLSNGSEKSRYLADENRSLNRQEPVNFPAPV